MGIFLTFMGLLAMTVVCTFRVGWEDNDHPGWEIWIALGLFLLGGAMTYVGL